MSHPRRHRPGKPANRGRPKPTKDQVRDAISDVDALDLPDGAFWAMVHDRLGLEYGDVFEFISEDPEFFNATEVKP